MSTLRRSIAFTDKQIEQIDQKSITWGLPVAETARRLLDLGLHCNNHPSSHGNTQPATPTAVSDRGDIIQIQFVKSDLTVFDPFAEKTQLPLSEYLRRLVLKIAQKWAELKGDDPQQAMLKKEVEDKVLTPLGTREPSQE